MRKHIMEKISRTNNIREDGVYRFNTIEFRGIDLAQNVWFDTALRFLMRLSTMLKVRPFRRLPMK